MRSQSVLLFPSHMLPPCALRHTRSQNGSQVNEGSNSHTLTTCRKPINERNKLAFDTTSRRHIQLPSVWLDITPRSGAVQPSASEVLIGPIRRHSGLLESRVVQHSSCAQGRSQSCSPLHTQNSTPIRT